MRVRPYESRPVTRLAHEIGPDDVIRETDDPCTFIIEGEGDSLKFKAYQPIEQGDFVVYLTDDDVYHCSRSVFAERNYLPGDKA